MSSSTLNLMDLPLEIFRQILAEAILCRGWKRGFRLRLVNKTFAAEIIEVIHSFRLLASCKLQLHHFGDLGHEFMARRLLNDTLPVSSRWASIRRIAKRLAREDGDDAHETYPVYLRRLCFEAAQWNGRHTMADCCGQKPESNSVSDDEHWGAWEGRPLDYYYSRDNYDDSQFDRDLFAAAVLTNKIALLDALSNEEIERSGFYSPYSEIFGPTEEIAATSGNVEALRILLTKLERHKPEGYAINNPRLKVLPDVTSASSVTPAAIGELLPSRSSQVYIDVLSREPQEGDSEETKRIKTLAWKYLEEALSTSNVEVFEQLWQYQKDLGRPDMTAGEFNKLLIGACQRGWGDMVRHLLGREDRPVGVGTNAVTLYSTCLMLACASGSEAAVRVLLEYGVAPRGKEIARAAAKGHWRIVRLLIEHGADVNAGSPIASAVAFEREDVFLELIGHGAVLTGNIGAFAMKFAKDEGLESMVKLLKEHGVSEDPPVLTPPSRPVYDSGMYECHSQYGEDCLCGEETG